MTQPSLVIFCYKSNLWGRNRNQSLHFLSPLSDAEATKIQKNPKYLFLPLFTALKSSVCKEQYVLKHLVVLLAWPNPTQHKGWRKELCNSGYDQDWPYIYSLKSIFWDLYPLSLLYSTAASCLKPDSYATDIFGHYIY